MRTAMGAATVPGHVAGASPGASGPSAGEAVRVPAGSWRALMGEHERRADAMTAAHRGRRERGERHPIEDFLYEYYATRPGQLRRWHPGAGTVLEPDGGVMPHAAWRWYRQAHDAAVALDLDAYLADRAGAVRFVRDLLRATAGRPAFTGCFGLHEWAMVYRAGERRHALPLRLGAAGTDAVVEASTIRCSHFDAFRFFTPEAAPRNRLQPTRESQLELDQPGCLHAGMDCHKYAVKLGPLVPGDLALDCFAFAFRARALDMQASPYDCSGLGLEPVAVETPEGRREYAARQAELTEAAQELRARLVAVCDAALGA
ncbi:MAG: 3-methyladenine DNA glycosylase [Kineosporiaceae bacterium]